MNKKYFRQEKKNALGGWFRLKLHSRTDPYGHICKELDGNTSVESHRDIIERMTEEVHI